MFSSSDKIKIRTGKNNVGRFAFLSQLVNEFKSTQSLDVKHQVMANLANFAYDPINYDHLRTLGVLNLFLEQLCEEETTLCRFALGGLCNLALDNENKDYINSKGGITEISRCLQSSCSETVQYAITTLMFLVNYKYKTDITSDSNIGRMIELADHSDKRIQNLAVIFLEDYCDRDQVHRMRSGATPLPPTPHSVPLSSVTQLPLSEQSQLATTSQQ